MELIKEIAHKNDYVLDYEFIDIKLIEEMAELTQALLKYEKDSNRLLEEVADVYVTLSQLTIKLDQTKLDKIIEYKLKRTANILGLANEDIGESLEDYLGREKL